ncbi:MAG: TetR/AcrR family transcriptional regulator [Bacteroidota bacterium]
MEKKEIQEQRMRGYFIQATKEMLKAEGLKSISVRNIADQAGYSYATIYNYFRDVKDLVFLCVKDFQQEIETYIADDTEKLKQGNEKITGIAKSYINYFVQYPGIFELFYIERVTDIGNKQDTIDLISNFLSKLCQSDWQYILDNGLFSIQEVENKKISLNCMVVGLLLLYLNRRHPAEYIDFIKNLDFQLKIIMD